MAGPGRWQGQAKPACPPAWLFEFLVNVIGLPENDVLDMAEDEAMQMYLRHVGTDA